MSLIIQTAEGVATANSYASADDLFLYAAERGIEITETPVAIEILLLKGMDYIESMKHRFAGNLRTVDQVLSFPRDVSTGYFGLSNIGVPVAVKRAQIVAAIAAQTIDLMPVVAATQSGITRKTVGPITVEYETTSNPSAYAKIPQADALLRPYFTTGGAQPQVIRG